MNIKAISTIAILGLFAAPAFPQGAPTKAAPTTTVQAAPAAAPAPAAPVVVTTEARAAIKELIDVTKTRENLGRTFQMMSQNLPPQMAQAMNRQIEGNTTLSAEQKQKVREGMNQPFDAAVKEAMTIVSDPKIVDQSIERMYPIYAKHFTADEIRKLTAFYKTDVGAKTLSTMPQVINESMQAGVSIFQPRLNALMEKTVKTQIDSVAAPTKK